MRHWLQLGTRNWRVRPGRTACALAAIALGVGVVVWVTCAYESVRRALEDQVWFWIGRSHLSVESMYGLYGVIPQAIEDEVRRDPNVAAITARLKHGMLVLPVDAPPGPSPITSRPATRPGEARDLHIRDQVFDLGNADALPISAGRPVQAVGIEPEAEAAFRTYDERNIEGRMIRPGDTHAAVLDRELAQTLNLELGDRFILRNVTTGDSAPAREREDILTLVGMLDMRRIAKRQKAVLIAPLPTIQAITGKTEPTPGVTRIDMILKNADPRMIRETSLRIQQIVQKKYPKDPATVTSAEGKLRQIHAAEEQTKFILLLISTVALFTAFFVILSTLSMGMVERIGQLGMLRCLGMTRGQIAALVMAEALPLGITGIALGVPVGFGFAGLSAWLAHDYLGQFAVSGLGLILALAGGAATTLLGALAPMIQATRVSPLVAMRSQAHHQSWIPVVGAAVIGAIMIYGHSYLVAHTPVREWFQQPARPVVAAGLLYAGYALVAPALVLSVGYLAVRLAAVVLRVRHQLLSDQVGRAAWRSAAICSGLMVGLSLVVSIVVFSESLSSGWDFPKNFSEAFVYFSAPASYDRASAARKIGGTGPSALANERLQCQIIGRGLLDFGFTRFVAGDPREFFEITQLEFVEGDKDDAISKLEQGGHVLVTPEFVRAQKVHAGDTVRLRLGGPLSWRARQVTLTVAGVVTSPALDIAANYFNAGEALTVASAFVVLGTFNDLEKFGMPKEATLVLLNFALPEVDSAAVPPLFAQEEAPAVLTDATQAVQMFLSWRPAMPERAEELNQLDAQWREVQKTHRRMSFAESALLSLFRDCLNARVKTDWQQLATPQRRWRALREDLVMRLIAFRAGTGTDQYGSVAALKSQIDRDLRKATVLFTSVPLVALIVAALGVGNLMMANVVSRTRQIAMLRAIGATREQIVRLVMGEALVLGILGCLLGLGLGVHMATSLNRMTEDIWGFRPEFSVPKDLVAAAVAFTMSVCLVAGLIPALRASRSNVIDALQAT